MSILAKDRSVKFKNIWITAIIFSPLYICSPAWRVHPSRPLYKIAKTQRILAEEHWRSFSLLELSKHIGWSPTWLSHAFRRYAGISLKEFTLRMKYCYALWRIISTGDSLKSIAYDIGYCDPLYFGKAFKRRFGTSPNMLRK